MGIDYNKRPNPSAPAQPGYSQPGVNLAKISLTKAAPSVSLAKGGERHGTMRVNLNWTSGAKKGMFGKLKGGIDLDLACLYELADGSKGVIQALGNQFGSEHQAPYIFLELDDRTGAVAGGENMRINLEHPERFRRILIFAMIYEGAPNWAAVDGVVTMYPTSGPPIEVRLDSPNTGAAICAIAQLHCNGSEVVVTREVQYINGAQDVLDQAYGYGIPWGGVGRK